MNDINTQTIIGNSEIYIYIHTHTHIYIESTHIHTHTHTHTQPKERHTFLPNTVATKYKEYMKRFLIQDFLVKVTDCVFNYKLPHQLEL